MKAFETLTVSTVVKSLNSEIYSKGFEYCNAATVVVEGGNIRYRVDGDIPTSTVGLLANSGDIVKLTGKDEIKFFRAIRTGSADATLSVDYSNQEN